MKMIVGDDVMMYAVLLLLKFQDSAAADMTYKHLSSRDLHVNVTVSPPSPQLMLVGSRMSIDIVVTATDDNSPCDGRSPDCDASVLMISVSSHNTTNVVRLTAENPLPLVTANNTLTGLLFRLNQSVIFGVDGLCVGRVVLTFEIATTSVNPDTYINRVAMNVDNASDTRYTAVQDEAGSLENASERSTKVVGRRQPASGYIPSHLLAVIEYHITVARRRRQIDDAFLWVVAAATLLNAFGLGCVTVLDDVRQELRKLSPPVLATVLCQFVVLPPVC